VRGSVTLPNSYCVGFRVCVPTGACRSPTEFAYIPFSAIVSAAMNATWKLAAARSTT
jgi:hypothetical protein